jgi:hypothetical protein
VTVPSPEQRGGSAHVLISRTCVNDCVFCATADKRALSQFPSYDEVVRFLERCAKTGIAHLMFSGLGEPTLDPHLERYLALAGSLGFGSICLFTNGHRLTRDKARAWKNLGLSDVLLSLHGSEIGHDLNVGRSGSFAEGMRALDIYVSEGYRAAVNTCLTRHSLPEIGALRERLAPYSLRAHTLAFPEWSGAVLRHLDVQVTYDEVAERAGELLPADDGVTCFDNLPYCLVRRRIREAHGVAPVAYLDGQGSVQLEPHWGKVLPDRCLTDRCPLLPVCPRFEKRYFEHHGWGRVLERVDALLDEIAQDRTVVPRCLVAAGAPQPSAEPDPTEPLTTCVVPPGLDRAALDTLADELASLAAPLEIEWLGTPSRSPPVRQGTLQVLRFESPHVDAGALDLVRRGATVRLAASPFDEQRDPDWLDGVRALVRDGALVELEYRVAPSELGRSDEAVAFFANLQPLLGRPLAVKLRAACRLGTPAPDPIDPGDLGTYFGRLWEAWHAAGRRGRLMPFASWTGVGDFTRGAARRRLFVDRDGHVSEPAPASPVSAWELCQGGCGLHSHECPAFARIAAKLTREKRASA